jgi:hypothetical protein
MTIRRLLPALLAVLLLNCAAYINLEHAARGAFARGDYDGAVYNACASLRHKPNNARAQYLLQDAFRVATSHHTDNINQLTISADRFRWDNIVKEQDALVGLNRAVRDLPTLINRTLPGGVFIIQTRDFTQAAADARMQAAEAHYKEGTRLAASSAVESQRQAALEFRAVEAFVPGYKDASTRFSSSRKAGTTRVALVPFEDKSGRARLFTALTDRITDEVTSKVMNDPSATEFLEIVTRERLQQVMTEQNLQVSGLVDPGTAVRLGRLLGVHDVLLGRLTQILYVEPKVESRTVAQEGTVVVRIEKYIDPADSTEKQRNIEAKVHAQVTVFTKTASVTVTSAYDVINVETGAIRKTDYVEGKDDYTGTWATMIGDRRALSGEYVELVQRSEPQPPSETQMVNAAAGRLAETMSQSLRAFFR